MLGQRMSAAALRYGALLWAGLGVAACTGTPPPAIAVRPADPAARVPAIQYRSVTAGGGSLRPAEPKPWEDLNRGAAPPGSGGPAQ
jgi:hypothetical protein